MKDDSCIFCKIANGMIPAKTIYEDEEFRVILDLSPAAKGHSLILPKQHFDNIYTLPHELTGKVFQLARRMAILLTDTLNCEGFNLVQNNGIVAGQTVFHFHLHLIPRYKEDGQHIGWNHRELPEEELETVYQMIQKSGK